jgi:hypothetical protein
MVAEIAAAAAIPLFDLQRPHKACRTSLDSVRAAEDVM